MKCLAVFDHFWMIPNRQAFIDHPSNKQKSSSAFHAHCFHTCHFYMPGPQRWPKRTNFCLNFPKIFFSPSHNCPAFFFSIPNQDDAFDVFGLNAKDPQKRLLHLRNKILPFQLLFLFQFFLCFFMVAISHDQIPKNKEIEV